MATAVVFAFAVDGAVSPVVGAAPHDVLARQLPRMLVAGLNGDGDRGVRFFPFLGRIEGRRSFLRLGELLEPAALVAMHKQAEARLLCDGILRPSELHFRVVHAASGEVVAVHDLPFDPRRPLEVIVRLEFHLMELLGWSGRPLPPSRLQGEALAWFLVLKDALLRREADFEDPVPDPLRPARRCVELAGDDNEVGELVLDFAAHALRRGEHRDDVASVLAALVRVATGPAALLERLAALAITARDDATGATALAGAARLLPERADLVERAAAMLFRLGRFDEACSVVERARARGAASVSALAQLAAVHDRRGDVARRSEIVELLIATPNLPVPVARLLVSFLLEEERAGLARDIAQRALAAEPRHAMLHFELARSCLLAADVDAATAALQEALRLGLPPEVAFQARRFLRQCSVPGLWTGTQAVERALAAGDLGQALAAAKTLLRVAKQSAEAWFLFGVVHHRLGRGQRAERALRRALRCDEQCADAHNRLGILLASRGELDAGHGHLLRAHQLAPVESSTLLHLAQTCALLGRNDEAQKHVDAAERLGAAPELVAAVRRAVLGAPS